MLRDSASIQAWRAAVANSASGTPVLAPAPAPDPTTSTATHAPTASTPAPTPTASSPGPVPSRSARSSPSPALRGLVITGLTITPSVLVVTGTSHARIRFKLSQAAHVSICVLNSQGNVVRELDRPGSPAGWATRWYDGYGQHHRLLPTGSYQVLVMASNASGSATEQRGLTVERP
jgi:FlgD Ig-like domain